MSLNRSVACQRAADAASCCGSADDLEPGQVRRDEERGDLLLRLAVARRSTGVLAITVIMPAKAALVANFFSPLRM